MFESLGDGAIQPDSPPPTSHQSLSVIPPSVLRLAIRTVELSCCAPIDVVRKIVIERDAIKLRRRLILLSPAPAAVERNVRAAVVALDHAVRIVRSDPKIVIVSVRHLNVRVRAASIIRTIETRIQDVNRI